MGTKVFSLVVICSLLMQGISIAAVVLHDRRGRFCFLLLLLNTFYKITLLISVECLLFSTRFLVHEIPLYESLILY